MIFFIMFAVIVFMLLGLLIGTLLMARFGFSNRPGSAAISFCVCMVGGTIVGIAWGPQILDAVIKWAQGK